MLSTNIPQTMVAVQQTVLDVRRAGAWLAARSEVDPRQLGIMGTSLGSMVGALAAQMEPRFRKVVVLLGGGGLVDAYYDDPRAVRYVKIWEAVGGSKEGVKRLLAPVDPLTCAANLRDRQVLIMAAKRDDIIPPRCSEALWEACGKQKIIWFDCTHVGAVMYIIPGLNHIVDHFKPQ
jgi:dienelactone hydrolase